MFDAFMILFIFACTGISYGAGVYVGSNYDRWMDE